jgi:N-acyl amino acid synthase of PEP-CTERM/exosortase system
MDPGTGSEGGSALSALFDQYFAVVPADTTELLEAAYALRYQVYCVEHPFEDAARQIGHKEIDPYDPYSMHAVLISKRSETVVGCVRLILPQTTVDAPGLPIRSLLTEEWRARLDDFPTGGTAEISRYAIAKMYRRREGESLYPDVQLDELPSRDARRLVPHMSLGLLRGVATLAAANGITTVCAAMAPALLRLVERFGLVFERLGPPIEYHGQRQPCVAECRSLLAGLADRIPEYYKVVARE